MASKEDVCREEGFTESCTGTGQSGSGKSCGGLYAECSCASSYQYTCTGTGYAGGAGSACGGKYTQCTCSSGYKWKDSVCRKIVTNGISGDEYYCDGKVVGIRAPNMDFFVSISSLENWMPWEEANESSWKTFCRQGRLPSKNELKIIYENKSVISSLSIAAGGSRLGDGHYWSSDYEVPDYYGPRYYYFVDMVNGDSYWEDANTLNVVRPVFKP